MKHCMECGSETKNDARECSRCYHRTDEFYTRSLSERKNKHKNILKARESYISSDYGNSVRLLSEIAMKEPKNINILFGLGRSLTNTTDYSRAMQVYDRALSIRPDAVNILYAKGICYMELGDLKEAKKCFIRSLELEPIFKNARSMMKKCEEGLEKEHDNIVREQMKGLMKPQAAKEPAFTAEPEIESHPGNENLVCSTCGSAVSFEDQYQMWWCSGCSRYIEGDMVGPDTGISEGGKTEYPCNKCGDGLVFVDEYQRWWCDTCRRYIGDDIESHEELEETDDIGAGKHGPQADWQDQGQHGAVSQDPSCNNCGGSLRFIDTYGMWWCDPCDKYLGEDEGTTAKTAVQSNDGGRNEKPSAPTQPQYPCRDCGTNLKFVEQHQRWWCDGCGGYI